MQNIVTTNLCCLFEKNSAMFQSLFVPVCFSGNLCLKQGDRSIQTTVHRNKYSEGFVFWALTTSFLVRFSCRRFGTGWKTIPMSLPCSTSDRRPTWQVRCELCVLLNSNAQSKQRKRGLFCIEWVGVHPNNFDEWCVWCCFMYNTTVVRLL